MACFFSHLAGRDLFCSPPFFFCCCIIYLYFGWFLTRLVGSLAGFLFAFLRANSLGRGFCRCLLFNPFRTLLIIVFCILSEASFSPQ